MRRLLPKIYGASKVNYTQNALEDLKEIERLGWNEIIFVLQKHLIHSQIMQK